MRLLHTYGPLLLELYFSERMVSPQPQEALPVLLMWVQQAAFHLNHALHVGKGEAAVLLHLLPQILLCCTELKS